MDKGQPSWGYPQQQMKLIIPGRYRKSRSKPGGKLEQKARAAFNRLKKKRLVTCATA